ncbi:MAG: Lrp/AsnC family transcriptional regulator [Haloarculaceae archaeon]
MARAYIFVKASSGEAEPLLDAVRGQEYVTEAHVVAGDFDLIVEAEAPEVADILQSAGNAIRGIDGVADTRTYVCLE